MPQITGTVTAVQADDSDPVRRGDLLVHLDDADARLAVATAEAARADAARAVTTLVADLQRRRGLVVRRSISAEELNQAELDANTAPVAARLTRRQLAVAQANLAPRPAARASAPCRRRQLACARHICCWRAA